MVANGVAFDEPQRARRIPEGKPDDRAIVIAVGCNVVAAKNVTPAHELFHLIQYGATYFKKGWFLEGQARWSEHALFEGGLGDVKYSPRGPWPQPTTNLPALFAMSADSEFVLWNPIAMGADPKGLLPQTPELRELAKLRYSDGSPVLRDLYLAGADLMREILIELGAIDDVAFKELGYADWSEANQTAPENDALHLPGNHGCSPSSFSDGRAIPGNKVGHGFSGTSCDCAGGIEVRNERMQKRMPLRVSSRK